MHNGYSILAIIPARGGSKGVPRKNIRELAGKPLIAWTIETVKATPCIDRLIVSTDDLEIAEIAEQYGASVPFLRPIELAQDDTLDLPVYQHVLTMLQEREGFSPDIVVWLRPTAPLRVREDIEASIEKLIQTKADWVRSVCTVEHHPYWAFLMEGDRLKPLVEGIDIKKYYRRQLLPPAYQLNGAVEVCWRATIEDKGLLYIGNVVAYVMPLERSVDMDRELDFCLAETIIKRRGSD